MHHVQAAFQAQPKSPEAFLRAIEIPGAATVNMQGRVSLIVIGVNTQEDIVTAKR